MLGNQRHDCYELWFMSTRVDIYKCDVSATVENASLLINLPVVPKLFVV